MIFRSASEAIRWAYAMNSGDPFAPRVDGGVMVDRAYQSAVKGRILALCASVSTAHDIWLRWAYSEMATDKEIELFTVFCQAQTLVGKWEGKKYSPEVVRAEVKSARSAYTANPMRPYDIYDSLGLNTNQRKSYKRDWGGLTDAVKSLIDRIDREGLEPVARWV